MPSANVFAIVVLGVALSARHHVELDGEGASALASGERERQSTVVASLDCIDRATIEFMEAEGYDDARDLFIAASAEAMSEQPTQVPTLVEAIAEFTAGVQAYYCAMSGNEACIIEGDSFPQAARSFYRIFSSETPTSSFSQVPEGRKASVAPSGPTSKGTTVAASQELERKHELEDGALTALMDSVHMLTEYGLTRSEVLRSVGERVAQRSKALALLQRGEHRRLKDADMKDALVKMARGNLLLLLAWGEPEEIARRELWEASADILLEEGACVAQQTQFESPLQQGIHGVMAPYMQLTCAVHPDCATIFASGMDAMTTEVGGSLFQRVSAPVRQGGRHVFGGMVSLTMRFLGVQRFGADVFAHRSSEYVVGLLEVTSRSEEVYSEALQAVSDAVQGLLHHHSVGGAGRVLRITADLLRRQDGA